MCSLSLRILVFFMFSACLNGMAQDNIQKIRDEFNQIEKKIKQGVATVTELQFHCPDYPELGVIKWYFEGDDLIKLSYNHGYEHSGSSSDYYFKNGNLFFLYYVESAWYFGENDKVWDEDNEYRFYLVDGTSIKCLYKHVKYSGKNPSRHIPNKELDCDESSFVLSAAVQELDFLSTVSNKDYQDGDCILPGL